MLSLIHRLSRQHGWSYTSPVCVCDGCPNTGCNKHWLSFPGFAVDSSLLSVSTKIQHVYRTSGSGKYLSFATANKLIVLCSLWYFANYIMLSMTCELAYKLRPQTRSAQVLSLVQRSLVCRIVTGVVMFLKGELFKHVTAKRFHTEIIILCT